MAEYARRLALTRGGGGRKRVDVAILTPSGSPTTEFRSRTSRVDPSRPATVVRSQSCSRELLSGNGRFEVCSKLGTGGTGVVHLVYDHQSGRFAAMKSLLPEFQEYAEQLLYCEAAAMLELTHPGVARVLTLTSFGDEPCLVLEYVRGETLAWHHNQRTLPPSRVVDVLLQVAGVLRHAHEKGIFHLDLKPSNVMLMPDGQVRVIDFAVGGAFWLGTTVELDPRAAAHGTPQYMAPEQWAGQHVSRQADFWAIGVMFYELVLGRLPFNLWDGYWWLRRGDHVRSILRHPELSQGAAALLQATLDPNPLCRARSADEVIQLLQAVDGR